VIIRLLPLLLMLSWAVSAQAFELITEQVTDDAYALVGEIGPRTYDNHALNNTLGFVVTPGGVVLVSSGASPSGARLIEAAVGRVSKQPIRWVINIGAQDHHWLGNSYFAERGAEIIALARTVATQHAHVDNHLERLHAVLKERAADLRPVYASRVLDGDRATLQLGGKAFELIWPGDGHFPGDAILWLPEEKLVFTGDLVFHDRMLGIHPFSPVASWQRAFHAMEKLEPVHVVPGHGHPGDLAKARRDTGDYLDWLVGGVTKALADWKELGETIEMMSNAPQFKHLKFYDDWHRRNIHQTYIQLESAQ